MTLNLQSLYNCRVPKKPSRTQPKRDVQLHIMISKDEERDFTAGAAALGGASVSAFMRIAAAEKVDRMRAEGKKL